MWVEFDVSSLPCSKIFSPGSPVFIPPQKNNTSKFQFDRESEGHRFVSSKTIKCYHRKIKTIFFIYSIF